VHAFRRAIESRAEERVDDHVSVGGVHERRVERVDVADVYIGSASRRKS
jgi:hypothetical protein